MGKDYYRTQHGGLDAPARNHFFHGKLLDVFHLELETNYFNQKRWLLNRLVTGYGVVCGLDVKLTTDKKAIIVHPGVAVDRCGREIVVPQATQPEALPGFPSYPDEEAEEQSRCKEEYAYYVGLCYRECKSDPVPAMVSDCEVAMCAPGSIRETYEIKIKKGHIPEKKSTFPDVIEGQHISYCAIVDQVTRPCRPLPMDCCIPLANILLRDSGTEWEPKIDIYIRPIVYTNQLLYELILSLVREEEPQ
ncbi:conserved hypothetical protein [Nitrosococcus oceani ATCC 19707]|uniref:Uncharacterized protein n=2 Tax=Nitrosococcus oceani TaxID=1229 RepID=Q3JA20_NITOC|nr:hypothetical protein [Nitrosococcus oceani]ABA58326.1 conserved hypothetical protein [Nitrosococcus oceani ATCC 19707]EDZ67713.1 hypothetical protein NOC27_1040 [Nitrosococcus oceani AFC27]KFI19256.1 hypothetical protein IB75_09910 [Nitrosococcus oceani C-27]GEM18715.1 hypothetical protein NONS58_00720 [Nitrosococcus oceani]